MKLIDYLVKEGMTPGVFAHLANVSPPTIYNVLKGNDIFLSIAMRIHKTSKGKVKIKDLINEEMIKKKRKRVYIPKLKHSKGEYQQAKEYNENAEV